jgi:hypothetical protein
VAKAQRSVAKHSKGTARAQQGKGESMKIIGPNAAALLNILKGERT